MREREWHRCKQPGKMLHLLVPHQGRPKTTERKLWLFGCHCVRRIWDRVTDERSRVGVEMAERYADGQATFEELNAAWQASGRAWREVFDSGDETATRIAAAAAWAAFSQVEKCGIVDRRSHAAMAADCAARVAGGEETAVQAELLRHLVGNPFRSYSAPTPWPLTVVQLAQTLYAGQDGRLPLSDALEEAGRAELARHFRDEPVHPRGCWLLDILLGKS